MITDGPGGESHIPRPVKIMNLPSEEWERAAVSAGECMAKEEG